MFLQLRVVLLLNFRKPQSFLQGAPNIFVVESSINIGCFREPLPFLPVRKTQNFFFREPPIIFGVGSPHHFFKEPTTFLQLRVLLLLNSRKPPSFIYLGSPQHFVFECSINIGCFREPPPFLQLHKSQKICLQGAPNKFWNREPPSLLKGVPNVFVVESSVVIGFQEAPIISLGSPQHFCS